MINESAKKILLALDTAAAPSGIIEVTIIIPCRNEEEFIGKCLDSTIAQDYPKDKMEVLVVDGMSEDGTRDIVEEYQKRYPFIKLMENPKRIIPSAMNIGIKNAKGEIIMKIDAHSAYENDYVSKCVNYLFKYGADNVGGLAVAVPRRDTMLGKAIVISLSHPFGVGNSLHRTGTKEPVWADTAFSGCYRKKVFDLIGLYDENIARSEDVAVNTKLRKAGGKILLAPEIKTRYYARSGLGEFIKHNFDNGFWITYPLRFSRIVFSWRHLVPLAFVSALASLSALSVFSPVFFWLLLFVVGLHFIFNGYFSGRIALKRKSFAYLLVMPLIFASLHISYGLGSLWGLLKVSVSGLFRRNLKKNPNEAAGGK